mgnify:CR=1 FL=1
METKSIVSMVSCLVPAIVMVLLNAGLYWQLNRLSKNDQFASASNELKKSLFKARLTNLIASIFICGQVAFVIYYSLGIVSLFSFEYDQSLEIIRLFQFLYSNETQGKVYKNPLEWKTLFKFHAYMYPIMIFCRLLNCSLNFYVYIFLRYRNKKAEIRRRQKRQQDREMVNLRKANTTDASNEQTA